MLVKMGEILIKTRRGGYGAIAVSCFSSELIKAAISAAEKKCSLAILDINLRCDFVYKEQDVGLFLYMARQRAMRSAVPVAINLDHDQNYQTVMRAISHGFTSVMVDAPSRPYEESITIIKEMVHAVHSIGFPAEAELGCVGMADKTLVPENRYTRNTRADPTVVKDFVRKTGMDFLAISVGDTRSPYAKNITPYIDSDLLEEVAAVTPTLLVLRGGSSTGDENLLKARKMRISKVSVGTGLMETAIRRAS